MCEVRPIVGGGGGGVPSLEIVHHGASIVVRTTHTPSYECLRVEIRYRSDPNAVLYANVTRTMNKHEHGGLFRSMPCVFHLGRALTTALNRSGTSTQRNPTMTGCFPSFKDSSPKRRDASFSLPGILSVERWPRSLLGAWRSKPTCPSRGYIASVARGELARVKHLFLRWCYIEMTNESQSV